MTKKKTSNADLMSKTALKAEVRRLRRAARHEAKIAAKMQEILRNLNAEIKRRDNATAHFREIEKIARQLAIELYQKWKADNFAPIQYGIVSNVGDIIADELLKIGLDSFWYPIAYEKTADLMQTIKEAAQYEN